MTWSLLWLVLAIFQVWAYWPSDSKEDAKK